jgi:hypothetical protein
MHGEVKGFVGKTQVLAAASSELEIKWIIPGGVLPATRAEPKEFRLLEAKG